MRDDLFKEHARRMSEPEARARALQELSKNILSATAINNRNRGLPDAFPDPIAAVADSFGLCELLPNSLRQPTTRPPVPRHRPTRPISPPIPSFTSAYEQGVRDTLQEYKGRMRAREEYVYEPPLVQEVDMPARIVGGRSTRHTGKSHCSAPDAGFRRTAFQPLI